MLDRLRAVSLPSLSDAVDGAWSVLDAGAQAASEACATVTAFASDALAATPRPALDWMPDTSPLPVLQWLFAPETPASAVAAVEAACAQGAGMSATLWDHFFPKGERDWSDAVDGAGLARFLRGQHPDKTAQHVAARTHLPADTVKKWLAGAALPNGRAILILSCAYGPELLRAMLHRPPGWLDAAARGAEQVKLEARLADLQRQLGRLS